MKKTAKLFGIIVLLAMIGLVMFACVDGSDGGTTNPCKNGHTSGAAATCETAQICTVCSQVIAVATSHNWGEWESDLKPATCTLPSHDTQNCLNTPCSKKNERTGSHPALGHNLPGAKAATCVATGLTGTGHCDRCNRDLSGGVIPIDSDNHDFGEWTQKTAATCVSPERQIRACLNNHLHTEEQNHGEINPTAHDYDDWSINTIAATCVSGSKDTATCKNSPCTVTNVRDGSNPINLTAHDWSWTLNAIAAICVSASKDTATCKNTPCTVTNERDGNNPINPNAHDHTSSLICKNGICGHQYEIGDSGPAGGIIFYVASSGFTVQGYTGSTGSFASYTAYYLEAAPANESSAQWGAYGTLIADVTTFTSSSASQASLIGNGRKDTRIIVNHLVTTSETGRAAQVCASKNLNGFTDWFLPSLGELNEMNKAKGQTGIPTTGFFWSSSQFDNLHAWFQLFDYGVQNGDVKSGNTDLVRAVRAF